MTNEKAATSGTGEHAPSYGPFVEACRKYGIGKTKAYALAAEGLLKPFKIGDRTFVYIAELESLPQRVAAQSEGGANGR